MKYTFHIVDVFSSTPFGGNQLAVLPDAAGISTEGMQEIAREFNFGKTTFVLPKNDPASTCRAGRRRRSRDRQRLCRPRRGNGIEARFWRDGATGPANHFIVETRN